MNARDRGVSTETPADLDAEGPLRRWARRKREVARENRAVDEARERGASRDLSEAAHAGRDPAGDASEPAIVEENVLADEDMPPLDSLDENSDYSGFLSSGVSEGLRRRALRKLFSSAVFNITDGLDDYNDDFTSFAALGDIVTSDMRHQAEVEAERERQARADAEPTAESDAEPTAESDAEPTAESDAEPTAGSDAEPTAGSDAEPTAGSDAEPTAESDAEPTAESDAESGRDEEGRLAEAGDAEPDLAQAGPADVSESSGLPVPEALRVAESVTSEDAAGTAEVTGQPSHPDGGIEGSGGDGRALIGSTVSEGFDTAGPQRGKAVPDRDSASSGTSPEHGSPGSAGGDHAPHGTEATAHADEADDPRA